jgi:putative ABC transport system permease protein
VDGGEVSTGQTVPAPLEDVLDEDFPEIEYTSIFSWEEPVSFVRGELAFRNTARYAGPDVFQILTFPFIAGDPATALVVPESVVLSESMARVYFAEYFEGVSREVAARNLLGEFVRYENRIDLTVTGVAFDAPDNSSITFEAFLPFQLYARENSWVENWGNSGFRMYVKVVAGVEGAFVSDKIRDVVRDRSGNPDTPALSLQALTERYLWSNYENGVLVGGRIDYVRIMGIVGLLILLIAAINFTNLATARSAQRAREIGVRKTFGGSRGGLVTQFMSESMATSMAALLLALAGVFLLLPGFNEVTGKSMSLLSAPPSTWLGFLGLTLFTGFLAGSYPAAYLSGLGVIRVLRQQSTGLGGGRRLRRGLVIFQFAASMLLIVGTLTVYKQIQFIQSANLGLDRENVITARLEGGARESWPAFKNTLLQSPDVLSVTHTDGHPFEINQSTSDLDYQGKDPEDTSLYFLSSIGYDYVNTLRMGMAAGRTFDPGRTLDSANVIINEAAALKMGLDNPIGQRFSVWDREGVVIGVVKDYHMQSMYGQIEPTILRLDRTYAQSFLVRAAPGRAREALAAVEASFRTFSPGYPFDPSFLDSEYDEMYRSERVVGTLANWFALLAMGIACLGLYGLASFTTSQRTKEIGVRKVLGASVWSVALLLTREFALLVAASFALATPIAWWLMSDWLAKFEYHVDLGIGLFLVTALGMLVLTYLTVGLQSVRAATANPARSLRSE